MLSRPSRRVRTIRLVASTIGLVANIAMFLGLTAGIGFIGAQAWDRAQVPFEYRRE